MFCDSLSPQDRVLQNSVPQCYRTVSPVTCHFLAMNFGAQYEANMPHRKAKKTGLLVPAHCRHELFIVLSATGFKQTIPRFCDRFRVDVEAFENMIREIHRR